RGETRRVHAAGPDISGTAHRRDILRHVGPVAAAVPRHLYLAVIRADPDDSGGHRRFRDGDDGAVLNGAAGGAAVGLARVIGGEIGADLLPVIAAIRGAEQHLRAGVQRVRIVRRED